MSIREAFGIRGILIRLILIIYGPTLIILVYSAMLLHLPNSFFVWVAPIFLGLFGYIAYVAMTVRFDNAVTEKSLNISKPMEKVCNAILAAIVINHWKLEGSNREQGRFRARKKMTIWTWGQIITIAVNKIDDMMSKVEVRCEAVAQKHDWGKNEELVSTFQQQLENLLAS